MIDKKNRESELFRENCGKSIFPENFEKEITGQEVKHIGIIQQINFLRLNQLDWKTLCAIRKPYLQTGQDPTYILIPIFEKPYYILSVFVVTAFVLHLFSRNFL